MNAPSQDAHGGAATAPTVRHQPEQHRFLIGPPGAEAVLEYRQEADAVVFTHTFVPPALRGGGVAAQLVEAGLAWTETKGLVPRAECSYVARVLERRAARS
jgi:predicted GNAT family acetyltransferase